LSIGVDAPEVKNIVLLRPIKTMIEFKQIIGRGTRIFEGKDYFAIYDFVKAHLHLSDPEWTETTVGNFNIRIYPNPTSDFITINNEPSEGLEPSDGLCQKSHLHQFLNCITNSYEIHSCW
jgi:type I site-specific restriction endonuclease